MRSKPDLIDDGGQVIDIKLMHDIADEIKKDKQEALMKLRSSHGKLDEMLLTAHTVKIL